MVPGLLIFDCDGVLVDSEPVAARVLAEALVELGLELTVAEVDDRYRGRSLPDIMSEIERELGRPLPQTFRRDLDARTREAFDTSLEAVPGIEALLEAVEAAGTLTCVASSGSPEKIHHSLSITGIAHFFEDRVFSAVQVARGKPAPDLFLFAAEQMGVDIRSSVIIEDSLPGVRGAVAAGARVLGFAAPNLNNPREHAELLRDLGAEPFFHMADATMILGLHG